ncbi:JAB domain-containing protein [Hymenobacter montanus]|nr:JAB domain-containing protein [Hymenobacter montanus]
MQELQTAVEQSHSIPYLYHPALAIKRLKKMNIKLTDTQKIKLLNSTDIYGVMQQVLLRENKIDRNKEHFWTIGLDNANRILYLELISLGTTTSVPVEPMQVFRIAVQKAALKMVLVHNHPTGEMKHSQGDIDITDRLLQVGRILGIEVIDHLIIGEKAYNSFSDTGLLQQIQESTRYVPNYQLQAKIKQEAEKIGAQKEKLNLAKALKGKGFPISQIVELTGISEEEAKKLKPKKA